MTFDRRSAVTGATQDSPTRGGAAPGKRTLTDQMVVQHTADHGTSGAGGPLPHQDAIQRSFGNHDVSGIAAHTDANAQEGADAMGAEAFATGNHVAFGGAPSLHTAAHEAAHVVQQRGGVQLKGGVGAAGDPHEQHADKVADTVVAGGSAQQLLDEVAPGGGGGAPAAGPVQHKLKHGATTFDANSALPLPSGAKPSPVVARLLGLPEEYVLPDGAPDFQAPTVNVLERKKYILGEKHGDGTFDTRTAPWPHVQKMKEGIKGMKPEGPEERNAIQAAGTDVRGTDKGQGLPLEDTHAYTMTRMLLQQQMLNRFDGLMTVQDGRDMVQDGLAEVSVMIGNYADVGLKWCQGLGERPEDGTRGAHFLGVGFDHMVKPIFKVMAEVAQKKRAVTALKKPEVAEIQGIMQEAVGHLLALIDTRPMGGGFMGMFQTKQGQDPIPNRDQIDRLATPGGQGEMPEAIEAGHPVREAAMIQNIKAAPAPLFVQIGDNHVDRVTAGVGPEAVPVKVGADFDRITQKA